MHTNLKTPTPEQAKERGRLGGIASGKKRRELKTARDVARRLLDMPLSEAQKDLADLAQRYGVNASSLTQKAAMVLSSLRDAQTGDAKAARFLLQLCGELPAARTRS